MTPVLSVFDELKDYLSDSDLSLDYKLARQRRKHRKNNSLAASRSLNRQVQLANLLSANRKPEGSSSSSNNNNNNNNNNSRCFSPANSNTEVERDAAKAEASVKSGDARGSAEDCADRFSSLPSAAARKMCAVTGHPRGRSLEPISEEAQTAHSGAADAVARAEQRNNDGVQNRPADNSNGFTSSPLGKWPERPQSSQGRLTATAEFADMDSRGPHTGQRSSTLPRSSNSIFSASNSSECLSLADTWSTGTLDNHWQVDNPYAKGSTAVSGQKPVMQASPSGASRTLQPSRGSYGGSAGLDSCVLVSAAQQRLQRRGQEDDDRSAEGIDRRSNGVHNSSFSTAAEDSRAETFCSQQGI